jgi:predicted Zn-dependent protease
MASALISSLEKLIGTPRDGALLRFSLGVEYLKTGDAERGIAALREAVARDSGYSAAWKRLGRALADAGREAEALDAWTSGIEAARRKGDRQAEREMSVFARRLAARGKDNNKPHA